MSTAAQRRAYTGPALFSFGFRPFFFFGAIWSALAVPLWVWMYVGGSGLEIHRDWHIHEMLFGFLAAVVAGFLTTAIPNWTGRMPVIGAPLAGLVALWAAGRMAMILEYWIGPAAGVVDSAFLVVFALVVWREVIAGRNWRNLPVCALVTVFALANVAFHLRAHFAYSEAGVRLGIAAIAMLLTLIGGRITPSFTRNWLKSRGELAEPAPAGVVDRVVLGLTGTATAAWVIAPEGHGAGVLLVLAGLANLVRLIRWRGWLAAREPLLWILHVGYAFLGVALILLGSAVLSDLIPRTAGLHALTAGAVGVMTLAVMTRATRGHTGRTLAADKLTALVYGAILVAAAARVSAPFLPGVEMQLLIASAFAWFVAYAGFATAYAPMLLRPRPDRA